MPNQKPLTQAQKEQLYPDKQKEQTLAELAACFSSPGHDQRLSYDDFRLCIDGKASGAVRISVGLVSNFEDAQKFLEFARGLLK